MERVASLRIATSERWLQRSHDLAAVERQCGPCGRADRVPASTEPRPRGRGEDCPRDLQQTLEGASTEPRPRGRGEKPAQVMVYEFPDASTEPRPRGRGEVAGSRRKNNRTGLASTEPRPRGRGEPRGPRRRRPPEVASTEPRPRGRGELRTAVMESSVNGFNGATTSRPWRGEGTWREVGCNDASTEPRPRGRGESLLDFYLDVEHQLQRSHDLAAVESLTREAIGLGLVLLQRSHDLAAVERTSSSSPLSSLPRFNGATTSRPWRVHPGTSTVRFSPGFNGATTSRPWRVPHRVSPTSSTAELQRSHDLAAVESRDARGSSGHIHTLQRSHDLAAVERRRARPQKTEGSGFNGATTSRPWRVGHSGTGAKESLELQRSHDLAAVESLCERCRKGRPRCRFNGATTSRPWRARSCIAKGNAMSTLQRSHDLAAVES